MAALLFFSALLGLSACGGGQDEELRGLAERIQGLEKESESLAQELVQAEKDRKRAERRLEQALAQGSAATPGPSGYREVCGTPPGDGAYGYLRYSNVGCEEGRAIAFGARGEFCASRDRCRGADPSAPALSGQVAYDGWICQIEDGWEMSRISCVRGDQALLWEAGA